MRLFNKEKHIQISSGSMESGKRVSKSSLSLFLSLSHSLSFSPSLPLNLSLSLPLTQASHSLYIFSVHMQGYSSILPCLVETNDVDLHNPCVCTCLCMCACVCERERETISVISNLDR